MSKTSNPPAFPCAESTMVGYMGMTLRDWFAGQAVPAIVAGDAVTSPAEAAQAAYNIADAMLAEREKGGVK